jgi:hypothetical protein
MKALRKLMLLAASGLLALPAVGFGGSETGGELRGPVTAQLGIAEEEEADVSRQECPPAADEETATTRQRQRDRLAAEDPKFRGADEVRTYDRGGLVFDQERSSLQGGADRTAPSEDAGS